MFPSAPQAWGLRPSTCPCRCETKTLDNVFVNVVVSVQYQVVRDNIYDALCAPRARPQSRRCSGGAL